MSRPARRTQANAKLDAERVADGEETLPGPHRADAGGRAREDEIAHGELEPFREQRDDLARAPDHRPREIPLPLFIADEGTDRARRTIAAWL